MVGVVAEVGLAEHIHGAAFVQDLFIWFYTVSVLLLSVYIAYLVYFFNVYSIIWGAFVQDVPVRGVPPEVGGLARARELRVLDPQLACIMLFCYTDSI